MRRRLKDINPNFLREPFRDQFTPAQEAEMEAAQAAAENEPLGTCVIHGDYWTEDCLRCDWGES